MGLYENRPNRFVIPRWREYKVTTKSGELHKEKTENSPGNPELSCKSQFDNWNKEKTIANALELINSAFVSGEFEAARDAALFVQERSTDADIPALKIANLILLQGEQKSQREFTKTTFDTLEEKIKLKIQRLRVRLNNYPNNPVLWVDYARWFTIIGKLQKAEKHIKTAIQLAPTNTYILRSAVRFYIHKAKFDKQGNESILIALRLIRKNPSTKHDPWLLATEISLSSYLDKTSNLMKAGFSLIEAKKFSEFTLSELTSAVATVELYNSGRKTKKLFTESLSDPNENSIAQAQWATNVIGDLPINSKIINSYEANSYHYQNEENWEGSLDEALNWLVDEPFSSAPANHASYISGALIDSNELSIKVCGFGLRSNPKEFTLLNNKAYAHAVENQTKLAAETFSQIEFDKLSKSEKITYNATLGLINYRNGLKEKGDYYYDKAEELAKKEKDEVTALRVKLYKLRSQHICELCDIDEEKALEALTGEIEKIKRPELQKTLENVKRKIQKKLPPTKPKLH